MDSLLNVIGELADVVAAACALGAICVTVRENNRISKQNDELENKRFLTTRFEALCLDRTVRLWDDLNNSLSKSFDELRVEQNDSARMAIYDCMEEECKKFEVGVRFLKIFNKDLYLKTADHIEKINDIVSESINKQGSFKWKLTETQTSRYLARIGEQGYKIAEELHRYECDEIWKK